MAKKQQKKEDRKGVILILLLLLGVGGYLLLQPAVTKGFEIQVEYRTDTGETGFLTVANQKTLATVGGIPGIAEIKLHPIVTNIGELDLQNVHVIGSSPQAFTDTIVPLNVDMIVGATQDFADPDPNGGWMDANALIGGDIVFQVTVEYSFFDAQGNVVTQDKTATLTLNIVGDVCTDGTPYGECSTTQPQKCIGGELIDSATDCGCPETYEQVDGTESCTQSQCTDGTIVGQCTSQNPEYCDYSKIIVSNCGDCGCPLDYYGNPTTCDAITGTCVYDDYVGDISIIIEDGSGSGPGTPPSGNVLFRTSSTNYEYGTAIAYTSTCGNALTNYGYYANANLVAGTCLNQGLSHSWCGPGGCTLLTDNIPGGFLGSPGAKLLLATGYTGRVLVCDDDGGQYGVRMYISSDADRVKVESAPETIDFTREVAC